MAGTIDDNQESTIEEAVRQFVDAKLQGRELDIDDFVKRYPGLEHQIKENIQELQKINTLFDCLTKAEDSDFENAAPEHELVGRKVGSFKIVEIIGRGGMGVVYLARDMKLDRSVAIKSMPAELQENSTTRARFKREAKLLASLNHTNIALIYEIIEQEEGASYLVLEYVPGQTLAQRIAREPLKLEETLLVAQQITEAVSAAHEKDVVHRDLKPSNIKITPEGKVKVLDFGLAKASVSEGKPVDATVTQPGRIMGTPAYMSPEQARGKPADKRSDIWSFGCIIYEMLTGQLPFEGETATDTLARIIEREPDWELLPQDTPTNIRTLLRRCLEKKPQRRLQHIGDAVIEISETLNTPATAPPVTTPSSTSLKPKITTSLKLRTVATIVVAAFVIVLSFIVVQLISKKEVQPSLKEIRLVVLPFENLGATNDEYFADGITDAITARLAGIHGLGVISRQSAIQYKKSEKDTRQIAKELGVDYILEGTIQRERPSDPNSKVRIIPQLIKASEDTHVWNDIYDDDMGGIFRLQSDVAERVAQALDITLLEPERRALQSRPTDNTEAYDYYMRGRDYALSGYQHENDLRIAIRMYNKAVELDPLFALAYARLSQAHAGMYWFDHDRSENRLAMAKQAADKAFKFKPNLPEAHLALGFYYYWGHRDYDKALEQFEIVRKSRPNNSELLSGIGYVQRRQGKFEQALTNIKRACELDPRTENLAYEVGVTFMLLRKYPEAEYYFERAISLAPDRPRAYNWKAQLYLCWEGNTKKARVVLQEGLENIKSTENFGILAWLVNIDVLEGNYKEALDRLSLKSEDFDTIGYFSALRYAQIYGYMDDKQLEKKYYGEARKILEVKIQEDPNDARFHSFLGIAYAGLGHKEEAIREGKSAVELLPITKEAMGGTFWIENLARIYVMVEEFDAAIDRLEFLLSIPSEISTPLLRIDPTWKPLCGHPRFRNLIEMSK
ncbi:MAG: protein kinase domain-containing protein [Planctomycetota bacterium]|jgi:serine/threonine protein kinase/Flp pilus assembly protein TadD